MCAGGRGVRAQRGVDYGPLSQAKVLECVRIPAGNRVRICASTLC
jgi:hypothetical protein